MRLYLGLCFSWRRIGPFGLLALPKESNFLSPSIVIGISGSKTAGVRSGQAVRGFSWYEKASPK